MTKKATRENISVALAIPHYHHHIFNLHNQPRRIRQKPCEKLLPLELLSTVRTHSTPLIHTNLSPSKRSKGTSYFTQHPSPVAHQRKNPTNNIKKSPEVTEQGSTINTNAHSVPSPPTSNGPSSKREGKGKTIHSPPTNSSKCVMISLSNPRVVPNPPNLLHGEPYISYM
ncbi:hypothetical protein EYC80_009445 [Monilinia laxa]|uniref:Uncharacterized protein n=1 Tax=Monilinia laxa TaxID=61186 RepID=A0A5N6JXW6_MONLA|nr:hypothetical protein EYC80_009445 [Monilinia laxa]